MHSNADTLLAQHPDIETVEALITDCNGAARGKWLPIEKLPTLLTDGIKLPKSAVAQDAWGRDVPRTGGAVASTRASMASAGCAPACTAGTSSARWL